MSLSVKAPRKNRKAHVPLSLDQATMDWYEPAYNPLMAMTSQEVAKAYAWYGYFKDASDAKAYCLIYFKQQGAGTNILSGLEKLPDYRFMPMGWLCRMASKGAILHPDSKEYLKAKSKELIAESRIPAVEEDLGPLYSSDDKMNDIVGELDQILDEFADDQSLEFECHDWLKSVQAQPRHVKFIRDYMTRLRDEYQEALDNTDEQVKEAYHAFKAKKLKAHTGFCQSILDDLETYSSNVKKARKPRKLKVKTVADKLAKLNYKKADAAMKLQSIAPELVLGATQLWTYNCAKRKLTQYIALAGGLRFKSTTLENFDMKLSCSKHLRKPEETLAALADAGKVALRTFMADIKALGQLAPSGRINDETILLKVVK